jgi:DNA-binding transcriptional LysR family regulator
MDATDRLARRLSLRDLRIVGAVAKAGSMSKAAVDLAISQPVVSQSISDLERVLGLRLFDRSRYGVEPTIYGNALVKCCTVVFDDLRQGIKEMEFLTDPTAGDLRIGCTEPLASGFVPTVIDRLSRQYPRLVFHVVPGDSKTLRVRELRQRNVELAMALCPRPADDDDINAEFLFDDRFVVLAGAQSRWTRRRRIELQDLLQEPWVLPPAGAVAIAAAFRAAGVEPPRQHVLSFSVPLHQHLLATGRFITMLPISVLHFSKHLPLRPLRVKLPAIPRPVAILTLKNRTLSPLARRLIETARQVAKQLPKQQGRAI